MAKSTNIQLGTALTIPIVYENRSALAIDQRAGWRIETCLRRKSQMG